jgi:hypothetical protein
MGNDKAEDFFIGHITASVEISLYSYSESNNADIPFQATFVTFT